MVFIMHQAPQIGKFYFNFGKKNRQKAGLPGRNLWSVGKIEMARLHFVTAWQPRSFWGWRRGELNPCPRRFPRKHLHVYPALRFKEPTLHRRTAVSRASANFLHRPARSLRRPISLLSTFGAVAGVQLQTSRSIKPRERDLGDLRLFVLARFLTRPTNHPRHAACASNHKSKPVRPHF